MLEQENTHVAVSFERRVGLALLCSTQAVVMGIVWPVDGVYKRVVGVADSTLGARVAGWGVFTLNILRRRGACAAPDKTGRASTSHAGRTKLFFSVRQGRRTSGMVCEGDGDQRTAAARAVSA